MRKKPEIIGAQNILPSQNVTKGHAFDKVTRQLITNQSATLKVIENFRPVYEQSAEYLGLVASNDGLKRKTALEIAAEDIHFGNEYDHKVENTLEDRLKKNHRAKNTI